MSKHIVVAVFVVDDQEDKPISDIRREFELGYMSIFSLGDAYTYEPKSISVTTINHELDTETEVGG